jgi:mannonate dehydratase
LAHLLHHEDLHAHLINGSDYPLPGVPPLISVRRLVASGLLSAEIAPTIVELRHYNPLLFDFVLKRHLAYRGKRFPAKVFETRRVLAARA